MSTTVLGRVRAHPLHTLESIRCTLFRRTPPSRLTAFPTRRPRASAGRRWDGATHGPKPRPDWVITALGAVESDLGILKTGKEADVHVVRRWVPDGTDHAGPRQPPRGQALPHQ